MVEIQFPNSAHKAEQYIVAGMIFSDTAGAIAGFDPSLVSDEWATFMHKLAFADDSFEQATGVFDGAPGLLEYLSLDTTHSQLLTAGDGLLRAMSESPYAQTTREHFASRQREALYCAELLRYQSPEEVLVNDGLWEQLGHVASAGIFLDSIVDAKADSIHMHQFSTTELVSGALFSLFRTGFKIHRSTWQALLQASHKFGFDTHLLRKTIRPFTPSAEFL